MPVGTQLKHQMCNRPPMRTVSPSPLTPQGHRNRHPVNGVSAQDALTVASAPEIARVGGPEWRTEQ